MVISWNRFLGTLYYDQVIYLIIVIWSIGDYVILANHSAFYISGFGYMFAGRLSLTPLTGNPGGQQTVPEGPGTQIV